MKPTNGRAESPQRAVARDSAEFLHDLTTLAELQAKLLAVDCRQGMLKMIFPAVAFAAGIFLAVGCVPIALAALTLTVVETTSLSPAQSCGISLLVGVLLTAVLTGSAILWLRRSIGVFDRSIREWQQNVQWVKSALKRVGKDSH